MPRLDDVYRKFGETAEAAQLLETELGTMLLSVGALEEYLLTGTKPGRATELLNEINSGTLGRILSRLKDKSQWSDELERLLCDALEQRNRLSHSFYRQHNFRRNSDEGRAIMLNDLQSMHDSILSAYRAVMLLSGADLDSSLPGVAPTRHLPI
jgi:hypothetical protein